MKILLILIIMLLAVSSLYAWEISVSPTYQDLDLSGTVKSNGIDIDLENDLGLDGDEPIGVAVSIDSERSHIGLGYAKVEFDGAQALTRSIQFRDQTYSASTYVESKLKYDLFEAQYAFDLLDYRKDDFAFSLAPLIKLSIYDASVNIKGGVFDETYSEVLPLPTLGIYGNVDITKYISATGQVSGIGYAGDTYMEYKGLLSLKPLKFFSIDVGYKGIDIDYSGSNNLLDIESSGPLFQATFRYAF